MFGFVADTASVRPDILDPDINRHRTRDLPVLNGHFWQSLLPDAELYSASICELVRVQRWLMAVAAYSVASNVI